MLSVHRLGILYLATTFMIWTSLVNAAVESPILKPQSPITVSITADAEQAGNQTLSFEVTASTKIMADELTIFIQIPSEAELKEGELFWRGPLQRGSSKTIHFTLSFPTLGQQEVTAIARIQQTGRSQYAARAAYRIEQPTGRAATKSQLTEETTKRSLRDGRRVVEHPLK